MEKRGKKAVKLDIEYYHYLSTFKHGVMETDIRFAFDNRLFDHPVSRQEEKICLSVLTYGLTLVKFYNNEINDHTVNVFHVMKRCKAWRDLVNLQEKTWHG
jgi:hypothetical protein